MRVCSVCSRCYSDAETSCVDVHHSDLADMPYRGVHMVAGYRIEYLKEKSGRVEQYFAKQSETNAECIIKVVELNGADPQNFLNDARAAAAMFHPNVVAIYGSGVLENGDGYYVAEASKTGTLRDFLTQGGLPPLLTSIQIIREMAEAVHVMHTNGLVHGALRPENVLLAADKSEHLVKVQNPDFGCVVARSIISNKLTIDSAFDVIRCFAPEQFASEEATPQTDVYALGVMLFEMLAGRPPFDGETASELIEKIRNDHPPYIKIDNFDLRMLLSHTLNESLQKQTAFRQPTALAFARQIRHIVQLATHTATPPAPSPGAIPQKFAAAAAKATADVQSSPLYDASLQKTLQKEVVQISKSRDVELLHQTLPDSPVEASGDAGSAFRDGTEASAGFTGGLNRARLRNWKEKYRWVTSAFRSDSNDAGRRLSITDTEPRNETAFAAQPVESKAAVCEESATQPTCVAVVQVNRDEPSPRPKPRSQPELFANYGKPSRRKRTPPVVREGLFSTFDSAVPSSMMNRKYIAAGFAIAVIVGLFFGSSLLERKEVRSARAETSEIKVVASNGQEAEGLTERKGPEMKGVKEPVEVSIRAYGETINSSRQTQNQPASKNPAPDVTRNPKTQPPKADPIRAADKPVAVKNAPKPALTPSTLVISPGNAKVKSKVEPGNGAAFSRPRVVANPKP